MKFRCPECKSAMAVQRAYDGMMHVRCGSCGIGDVLEYAANPDEVFLRFLSRYDRGLAVRGGGRGALAEAGITRDPAEVQEMIRRNGPDEITEEVLRSSSDYVSEYRVFEDGAPEQGAPVDGMGLDASLAGALRGAGIERFHAFQEEAISRIMAGRGTVIEAPTASGKTEAFLVPVIQGAARAGAGRIHAILVYPTKALARDQYPKIVRLAGAAGTTARIYDGDTPEGEKRRTLESPPGILVTNFDALHYHLMHNTRLAGLLATARVLVADEVHVYSGIFGTNVHYIIKRLGRVCGGRLLFVAASATLDDAAGFCTSLFGTEMGAVRGRGRQGRTDFVMLFPSLRTQRALMVDLARRMTGRGHRTMVFSNSHRGAELVAMQARRQKVNIRVHRAGLSAAYRESVERGFRGGSLDAISCTPTLELGIDVGSVDCVVSSTIPVNRLMQRVGRAARKGQRGYAFLALGNDPISQYYRNHPDDYFEDVEKAYIDPANPFVEEFQVLAMACDRPISPGELPEHKGAISRQLEAGNLAWSGGRLVPDRRRAGRVLREYSIRGIGDSVGIRFGGRRVGERSLPIALEELHKDAIYFLAGTRYRVARLEYPRGMTARLESIPRDYPYYTRALTEEWPTIRSVEESRTVGGIEVAFCRLHIRKSVHGYANIEMGQEAAQGQRVGLDEPLTYDFATKGLAFCAPRPADAAGASEDPAYVEASGYHATEHLIIEGSNMITGGASQDLGGISMGTSGMIFVYDGAIGGSGASRALYDRFGQAVERGREMVGECPCTGEAGCPRCTFSYRCGNNNEYLHKLAALEILGRAASGEVTRLVEPTGGDRPLV